MQSKSEYLINSCNQIMVSIKLALNKLESNELRPHDSWTNSEVKLWLESDLDELETLLMRADSCINGLIEAIESEYIE